MGRKNIVYDFKPIDEADMSQARIEGATSTVAQFDEVTYHFEWSGADVGGVTFGVEYKLSEKGSWYPLDFGSVIDTDTADGMHRLVIQSVGFKFLRPISENVTGGGTLTVHSFCSNKGA